jgi:hypothetical protein
VAAFFRRGSREICRNVDGGKKQEAERENETERKGRTRKGFDRFTNGKKTNKEAFVM